MIGQVLPLTTNNFGSSLLRKSSEASLNFLLLAHQRMVCELFSFWFPAAGSSLLTTHKVRAARFLVGNEIAGGERPPNLG